MDCGHQGGTGHHAGIKLHQSTRDLDSVFLQLKSFPKVRHRLFGWTEEGAGAEGGNRLLWMKERKFAVDWKDFSELPEKKEGEVDEKEEEEVEQSLDVRSQIDWWDTRAEEETDTRVAKCPFFPFALLFLISPILNRIYR